MRSIVFRFADLAAFASALDETRGSLPLPEGETVLDGEWILAIFELGSRRRATAAAARGVLAAGDPHIAFERRDWERIQGFVAARSEHLRAVRPLSTAPLSTRAPTSVDFPPDPYGDEPPPSRAIESSRVPLSARVLLVDPDGDTREDVCAMLAEVGLYVETVASPAEAEERMRAIAVDVLVIDVHADEAEPFDFVRMLRKAPRPVPLPVLFLSSAVSSRAAVEAFACGADDFLPKPFRAPELGARVFGLLRRARLMQAAGAGGRP